MFLQQFEVLQFLYLNWFGFIDCGKFCVNNEDFFFGIVFDGYEVCYLGKIGEFFMVFIDFVFVVSDGMGGVKFGEFVSCIVVDKIMWFFFKGFCFFV